MMGAREELIRIAREYKASRRDRRNARRRELYAQKKRAKK